MRSSTGKTDETLKTEVKRRSFVESALADLRAVKAAILSPNTPTSPLAPKRTRHSLDAGGFAYLPPGARWSLENPGSEAAQFHWLRKRYEAADGLGAPEPIFTSDQEIAPSPTIRPTPTNSLPSRAQIRKAEFSRAIEIALSSCVRKQTAASSLRN